MDLHKKKCLPCEGIGEPLNSEEADKLMRQIPRWKRSGKRIFRKYRFKDFNQAMKFIKKMAGIAKKEDHHPDFYLHEWNKVDVELWTHALNGLTENDFIVAAKINRIKI